MCINDQWGTVCDDYWSAPDATVICRQLGYAYTGSEFTSYIVVSYILPFLSTCRLNYIYIYIYIYLWHVKQMLYSTAGEALLNAYFGQGTGQIVLDDVQCTGWENQLLACRGSPILDVSSNCDHSDDAGMRCEGILYVCTIIKMKSVHCVIGV